MFSSSDPKKVEIKKESDHPPSSNNHTGTAKNAKGEDAEWVSQCIVK